MAPEEVVERLCKLPHDFNVGKKSPSQLVAASGVARCEAAVSTEALAKFLARHPELVEEWLHWSEDKRVSSGWYFLKERNEYVVGYYPNGERLSFADPVRACAEFVNREIEAIRA